MNSAGPKLSPFGMPTLLLDGFDIEVTLIRVRRLCLTGGNVLIYIYLRRSLSLLF